MFILRIEKLLKSKGIDKPYTWLKANGIYHHMAYKLLHKPSQRIPIDVLHTICEAAWCTPSDLFEWIPDDPIKDVPEHPLQALKPKETINILPDIAKLTPAQLAKLQAEIKKGMLGVINTQPELFDMLAKASKYITISFGERLHRPLQ